MYEALRLEVQVLVWSALVSKLLIHKLLVFAIAIADKLPRIKTLPKFV
ncbi:hypothetical protein [Nostoc sp. ChiVER01]|nr:hypothetical protein [Nostoc sp. ChiVER01]MDZ8225334.1 hypothetical protein [Nostoc sp. ChiVER01]